jgi:nucleoside 2-deoxyribosyltransferase/GNAT superfamily N-acetyltransferase
MERSRVVIEPFVPQAASRGEWAAYHRYRRQRGDEASAGRAVAGDAAVEHDLLAANPVDESRLYVARFGAGFIGRMALVWRREGTARHERFAPFVIVAGAVLRRWQHRGTGTAFLVQLERDMQTHGFERAVFNTDEASGIAFLRSCGAEEALRTIEYRLELAGPALADPQGFVAGAAAFEFEAHAPRVPLARLEQLMAPLTEMLDDVPRGSLRLPIQPYEIARYPAMYARMDARGGMHLLVLATLRGEIAAASEAVWDPEQGDRVQQTFTGVARPYRGHGLARAVKARLVQLVGERLPQVQRIVTNNAVQNLAMRRVNEAIGFEAQRESVLFELGRERLAEHLARLGADAAGLPGEGQPRALALDEGRRAGCRRDNAGLTIQRIYLAGPDVFRPDAAVHGRTLVALCAEYGFDAVFPLDEALPGELPTHEAARRIYDANVTRIDACDAVLANLDFFRGPEPDSGTCFEVGYAIARGKTVVGYVPESGSLAERIRRRHPDAVGGGLLDAGGWHLEEFGLPLNLMLAVPCRIVVGGVREALELLRAGAGA